MGWVLGAKPRSTGPGRHPLGGVPTVSGVRTPHYQNQPRGSRGPLVPAAWALGTASDPGQGRLAQPPPPLPHIRPPYTRAPPLHPSTRPPPCASAAAPPPTPLRPPIAPYSAHRRPPSPAPLPAAARALEPLVAPPPQAPLPRTLPQLWPPATWSPPYWGFSSAAGPEQVCEVGVWVLRVWGPKELACAGAGDLLVCSRSWLSFLLIFVPLPAGAQASSRSLRAC